MGRSPNAAGAWMRESWDGQEPECSGRMDAREQPFSRKHSMNAIELIAEQRIREAMARGDFDRLSGMGKPLELDDDKDVPADLRVAYRILKNAGCVPPEIRLRREIASAEQLLTQALSSGERQAANQRLEFLLMKLSAIRRGSRDARVEAAYYDKLAEKVQSRTGEHRS
jgi:hypothetical protein